MLIVCSPASADLTLFNSCSVSILSNGFILKTSDNNSFNSSSFVQGDFNSIPCSLPPSSASIIPSITLPTQPLESVSCSSFISPSESSSAYLLSRTDSEYCLYQLTSKESKWVTATLVPELPLTISIAQTRDGAEANGGTPTDAVFTVTVTPANTSGAAITGSIGYTGTASNGTDYATGATTFSIADGASTATITLGITEDTAIEGIETVIATLSNPSTGTISTAAATATISDDDHFSLSIAQTRDGAEANGGTPTDAVFTVTVTPANTSGAAITGSIGYTGTASNGTDYATGATTFSIADGASTATITLGITEDTAIEGIETVIATLSNPSIGSIDTAAASANITDDESGVEINIKGGSSTLTSIVSGDTSPRNLDGTDFGTSNIEKVFMIENIGNIDLTLSGTPIIALSSNSSSAFSISEQPSSTLIGAGSSRLFKINYIAQVGKISTATVIIMNDDSDESRYTFNIQGGESSAKIPPRVEKLRAFLAADNNQKPLRSFQNSGGNLKFAFDIVDSDGAGINGANYSYTWVSPNNSLNSVLSGAGGTFFEGTTTSNEVIISSLSAGRYPLTVKVSDSDFNASTGQTYMSKTHYVLTVTTTAISMGSDNIDIDGDGIVDSDDDEPNRANNVVARLTNSTKYASKVPTGVRITLGITALTAARTGLKITTNDLSSHGKDGGNASNIAINGKTIDHIFDYIVEGIPVDDTSVGNTTTVILPLETALTISSTFHKYSASNEKWNTFISDAKNKIEWAGWQGGVTGICPDPDSASYNNTTTQVGKTCLRVTVEDGGVNDQDSTVNGTIVDPFGIATPTPVVSTGGGSTYVPPVDPCANMGAITSSTPNEGNCDFINYFVLTLAPALDIDATVDFITRDGSAKAGEDYITTSGTVTMRAGETQLLIPVKILADSIIEDDESFDLILSNPTGATFSTGVSEIITTHTITNDDSSYVLTPTNVTAQSVTTEGINNHINYFQLALDKVYDHDIIVSYHTRDGTAKAGKDYIALSRKVKILAGQTKVMLGVTVIADMIKEDDETFSLVISNPIGEGFPEGITEITATHTIIDDD